MIPKYLERIIDLNKGEISWQIPLGEYPELVKKGIRNTGTETYGGPVVTKGGLIFIAATMEKTILVPGRSLGLGLHRIVSIPFNKTLSILGGIFSWILVDSATA